jgi:hypothetical protein
VKKVAIVPVLVLSLLAQGAHAQAPAKPGPAAPAKPTPATPGAPGAQAAPAAPPAGEPIPPPPAAPVGPPPLSETLTGEPKTAYESGKLLYGDGDYAGALVKFTSAYSTAKDARLLWNMAACEKNLRHYSRALRLVRQYVKDGEAVLTPEDKTEAGELMKVMEPFTAKLKVNVSEPGAEVSVDDEALGPSPVEPVLVDIGTRKIRVRKEAYEEFAKDVPVGGAAEVALDVKLVKIVHEGRLVVKVSNDATIAVDDQVVGTGTWAGVLVSGGHTLKVTAPKMRVYQAEVLIQDKQSREVAVTLEAEPSKGLPLWAWVAGGAVVAGGLGVGGYFLFKPTSKYDGPGGNLSPGVVQASAPIHFR